MKRLVDVAVASRTFTGERRISRWEMNNQQAHRAITAGKVEPANSKVAFVQVSPVCVVWVWSVIMCDVEWALTATRGELCHPQFYNVFKSHPDQLRWDDSNGVGVFVASIPLGSSVSHSGDAPTPCTTAHDWHHKVHRHYRFHGHWH